MYVLPLVQRELIVALRRRSTFRLRMAAGAGTMAAVIWAFLVWGSSFNSAGVTLFYIFCWIAEISLIFASILVASDSICLEKREGTLPFLFLTELNAWDIVLGKLAAAGIVPVFTLFAMFPALAVCQLMGGLKSADLCCAFLALLATLFFALSATLLASSTGRHRRTAVLGAIFLLVLFDPLWLLYFASSLGVLRFFAAFFGYLFLGTFFLFLTVMIVARSWREDAKSWVFSRLVHWLIQQFRKTSGSSDDPILSENLQMPSPDRRRSVLEKLPVAWMMLRRRESGLVVRSFLMFGLAVAAMFIAIWLAGPTRRISGLLALFLLHVAGLLSLLARTAYSFYNDRQEGSLELLLGTPLSNAEIFEGFDHFLRSQSSAFLTLVTALDCLLAALLWSKNSRELAIFPIAMAATLWISFYAVRWLGVYRSLMMNHPSISMIATFSRLSFFPIVTSALFLWAPRTDYFKVSVYWIISTAFLALLFGNDARRVLIERGRKLLLRPYSEKPPHIESDWSFINWDEVLQEDRAELPAFREFASETK